MGSPRRARLTALLTAVLVLLISIATLGRFVRSSEAAALRRSVPDPNAISTTVPLFVNQDPVPVLATPTPLALFLDEEPRARKEKPRNLNHAFVVTGQLVKLDTDGLWVQGLFDGWRVIPRPRHGHTYGCHSILDNRVLYITTDIVGAQYATVFNPFGTAATVTRLPDLDLRDRATNQSWCNGTSADGMWVFPHRDFDDLVFVVSVDYGMSFEVPQTLAPTS